MEYGKAIKSSNEKNGNAGPDLRPKPNSGGSCATIMSPYYPLSREELMKFNKKTYGWSGCENSHPWANTIIWVSGGSPPKAIPNPETTNNMRRMAENYESSSRRISLGSTRRTYTTRRLRQKLPSSKSLSIAEIAEYLYYNTGEKKARLMSHVNFTGTTNSLVLITNAGVLSNKILLGLAAYVRSFKQVLPNCDKPHCDFTGPESGATSGKCSQTAGYLSLLEIEEIESSSRKRNSRFDDDSLSTILAYDEVDNEDYDFDDDIYSVICSGYSDYHLDKRSFKKLKKSQTIHHFYKHITIKGNYYIRKYVSK
ncbi:hypothetical protein CONCODRAFT_9139 [Conidiobolus coronatus NRRL 28638]|uniref:Uncharacterized protein n=1 Tax=Conidiobolus coronatus (strain ATCC 28846 / CBS 209.66 / NRRL 28638) TaxID=796925 RepID=A0A137P0Q6_CONC2|nr:hypothetical protein CONCODRAFT_9139 [Conidiobolus coronatus NRRL 28638]|eukprot:KXN68548.1 hypothetical protein CONCODRAFT_9139 [Conidiobolus coronatus NRRL 28638]